MNKSILYTGLAIVALAFTSCKKDKTPPVISLNGDKVVEVTFKNAYADAGATATDDEDGNITSKIEVTNNVNTSQLGEYQVTYTVSDEKGNTATESRTVKVVMKASSYAGNFGVTHDCSLASPVNANQSVTVVSSTKIEFNNFFTLLGGTVPANISNTTVTIIPTTVSGYDVSGSGTLSADGNTITMDLTIDPPILGAENCIATYTRQ